MTITEARNEERELLRRMAGRDGQAWSQFLDLYGDLVYSQLEATLRRRNFWMPSEDVSDLVQSLFESFLANEGRKLLSFEARDGCSLSSWLKTVATNHALSAMRRRKSMISLEEANDRQVHSIVEGQKVHRPDSPREAVEKREDFERLLAALGSLSERERLIFQLYYGDEYSGAEVARILGMTSNHVDQCLYQMRRKLKEQMVR